MCHKQAPPPCCSANPPTCSQVDIIKQGAFGCVALAKDTMKGSLVALKFVRRGRVRWRVGRLDKVCLQLAGETAVMQSTVHIRWACPACGMEQGCETCVPLLVTLDNNTGRPATLDQASPTRPSTIFLQGALECAEAEVLNQSRLRHPHIVALHEVGGAGFDAGAETRASD